MKAWFSFLCGGFLIYGSLAFGAGSYQPTKDGKTIVWNENPKPGDSAAWSGHRDRDGYATGFGTLTRYRSQPQAGSGRGASAKPTVDSRYFGNMVRGKFGGPVNLHSNGKTAYVIFVDGRPTGRWTAGPAPSRIQLVKKQVATGPEAPAEGPRTEQSVAKTGNVQRPATNDEHSRERTTQPPVAEPQTRSAERSQSSKQKADEVISESTANKKPSVEVDDSLRSLAWAAVVFTHKSGCRRFVRRCQTGAGVGREF